MDEHEPAAAEISGVRVNDSQREPGGDGGVDGIAALLQHFKARGRCQAVG